MTADILAGYLLTNSRTGVLVDSDAFVHTNRVDRRKPGLLPHWEQAVFSSDTSLIPGDDAPPPDGYPLMWRLSGPRVLIVSQAREVVEGLCETLALTVGLKLDPVSIAVDTFVKDTAREPGQYVFNYVHARVAAFGTSLKSLSFYGDDISEAKFFRDGIDLFNCHTCGIRHITGGGEIVRLGNDGSVSFRLGGPSRLKEVEQALAFLRLHGYLGEVRKEDIDFNEPNP